MDSYKNDYEIYKRESSNNLRFMCKCLFTISNRKFNGSLFITDKFLYLIRAKSNDKFKIPLKDLTQVNLIDTFFKNQVQFMCGESYKRTIYLLSKKELKIVYDILNNELNNKGKFPNKEIDFTDISDYKTPINRELIIPDVIVLWWYSVVKNPEDIPAYFEYRYEINFNERKQLLTDKGYLSKPDPITYIHQLKNNDLKSILRENNLKVSGNKKDLISRIQNELSNEQLSELPNNKFLMPTKDGYEILRKYSYIVYGHKHFDDYITPLTMYDKYNELHSLTGSWYLPGDVAWTIYNEIELDEQMKILNNKSNNYGTLRNINMKQAFQLKREKHNKDALVNFLNVVIIDFCEVQYRIIVKNIYKEIVKLRKDLNLNSDEFGELVDKATNYVSRYLELKDIYDFYEILTAYLENNQETISKYEKYIK